MILAKVYTVIILSLASFSCQNTHEKTKQIETLCEVDNLKGGIERNLITVSGLSMGVELSKVEQVLGSPTKTETYDNELSNAVHELLYYGSSQLEFYESKLVSFEILSDDVILESFNIKVGGNIKSCSSLYQLFKESLLAVKDGESIKLRIPIKGEDEALIIKVDDKGVISSVFYWVNW